MAHIYESDATAVIKAAFMATIEQALYMEIEHESGPASPCPDYIAHLRESLCALDACKTLEDVAAVAWVQGRAATSL